MTDLSLISMDELIKEINKRTDVCVVAYVQKLSNNTEQSHFYFHGGRFAAIGLCEAMKCKIVNEVNIQRRVKDENNCA